MMQQPSPSRSKTLIRRHSLLVRVTHWVNALCFAVLLMSGLQIFNAHPRLYVGLYGADHEQPVFEIGNRQQQGFVRLGSLQLNTTGVLGVSKLEGTLTARAFPGWMTLPSWQDLGAGRHWHFFFAWLLLFNGVIYLLHGFWYRHFRRDLLPDRQQLGARHLWQEICDHARLRFARGEAARRYNALQKLSYLLVIFILLPLMLLSGLTLSPALDAALPFLPDLFGGRPTARTVHFITATLLVLFVLVHVVMVLVSGVFNNLRSMITGRYAIDKEDTPS